jgi:histidine ammonia-lyase
MDMHSSIPETASAASPLVNHNQEFSSGSRSLLALDRELESPVEEVVVGGIALTASDILAVARRSAPVRFIQAPEVLERIATCHARMMSDVRTGVPVYGCNTGYGGRAASVLADGSPSARVWMASSISEAISAIDISVGPPFSTDVIRAGILLRINMLMGGVSAVKLDDLHLLSQLLNKHLTPFVQQFGGLGASGDLAQNARVVSVLRQLSGALVWDRRGQLREAREALSEAGLEPLQLDPKAGLGLCNGDNFSTALAILITIDTLHLLLGFIAATALTVEALQGSDRCFHPMLDAVRPHNGQREVASLLRCLLAGSGLARQDMNGHTKRPAGHMVQDGYSLRGVAQYLSVSVEKVKAAFETLTLNANSVSDNPLWVPPQFANPEEQPWQWVSGANFLAMHAGETIDGLRKVLTWLVKLGDRHLARLVTPHHSNGLPANLSDAGAFTGCTFKGVQIQSGMFDVYSTLLSFPINTLFGVHEEGNQDITTHALTSGILALENLRLARYALAQNLLALAQAVECLGGQTQLSPRTRPIFEFVRNRAEYVTTEKPLHQEIERLYQSLLDEEFSHLLRTKTFAGVEEA